MFLKYNLFERLFKAWNMEKQFVPTDECMLNLQTPLQVQQPHKVLLLWIQLQPVLNSELVFF